MMNDARKFLSKDLFSKIEKGIFALFAGSVLAVSGCATAPLPPLTANDPANPQAREASVAPAHHSLAVDATTRKTDALFSAAQRSSSSSSKPHEMSGMQMDGMDMSGMKMGGKN